MKNALESIKNIKSKELSYSKLKELIQSIDLSQIEFRNDLPKLINNHDYERHIYCLKPFEIELLHWPPNSESAIHLHRGFCGYVAVLEGQCENIEYAIKGNKLKQIQDTRGLKGALIPEPEGVIHKLKNASRTENLVTMHFYLPALTSLEDLEIFNEDGDWAILSEQAKCASFIDDANQYKQIERKKFMYEPFVSTIKKSHRIHNIIPKPKTTEINDMIGRYYAEQASSYDSFDTSHSSRNAYTQAINRIIAEELRIQNPSKVLNIACGTGRRALAIKNASGLSFESNGLDMSQEMCEIASERGIETQCCSILDAVFEPDSIDAATFLYAFGHIDTEANRIEALKRVHTILKPGGVYYFDCFNKNNQYEWGKQASRNIVVNNLKEWGYDDGDVFYQKTDGKEIAYLHYFSKKEIVRLLELVGFEIEFVKFIGYVNRPGVESQSENEGSLFVKAIKRA